MHAPVDQRQLYFLTSIHRQNRYWISLLASIAAIMESAQGANGLVRICRMSGIIGHVHIISHIITDVYR